MRDFTKKSLFRNPSFSKGVARTVAMFGGLDSYRTSGSNAQTDAEAIKQDWIAVGQDLTAAVKAYGKDH